MKRKILRWCVGFMCLLFGILSIDWFLFTGCAYVLHCPYRGAFFPEVWGVMNFLFSWMPEHTFTRGVIWFLTGIVTISAPVIITLLLGFWFMRAEKKQWD